MFHRNLTSVHQCQNHYGVFGHAINKYQVSIKYQVVICLSLNTWIYECFVSPYSEFIDISFLKEDNVGCAVFKFLQTNFKFW